MLAWVLAVGALSPNWFPLLRAPAHVWRGRVVWKADVE